MNTKSEPPKGDVNIGEVEKLSSILHDIYQKEAHRQEDAGIGTARHYDEYEKLSEPVKEFDRVLARYIIQLLLSARAEERERVREDIEKALSDSAPFDRDQLQFANNLIEQKNEILTDLLTRMRGNK